MLFVVASGGVYAQQDPMYTHYLFNTLAINPAYAGSRGALSLSALARMQWVGIDGAPNTQTFFAHTPFISYNMGLGLTVIHDKVGPVNRTLFFGDYSYSLIFNDDSRLSFGLKAGFDLMKADLASLDVNQSGDESFTEDIENRFMPNFGAGIYYRSNRWYAGISTPQLIENKIKKGSETVDEISQSRHYFLIGGCILKMNQNFKLKPAALVKATAGAPVGMDFTASLIYRDFISFGLAYRRQDSFGALLEINLTDQLTVGYAYDYIVSELNYGTNGSHEIMIRYDFNQKTKKIFSPRYF